MQILGLKYITYFETLIQMVLVCVLTELGLLHPKHIDNTNNGITKLRRSMALLTNLCKYNSINTSVNCNIYVPQEAILTNNCSLPIKFIENTVNNYRLNKATLDISFSISFYKSLIPHAYMLERIY